MKLNYKRITDGAYTVVALWLSVAMLIVWILPMISPAETSALQIEPRKLTMSSGSPAASNATTTYTLNFTVATTGTAIQGFQAQACTTSVGTCTTPTGFSVTSATLSSQPTNLGAASGWTVDDTTSGTLALKDASNSTDPTGAQTVVFGNVQNPTTGNTSFYLRMTTFSSSSYTGAIDTGTVAGAVVTALQVQAYVAEELAFCVGASTVNDLVTAVGTTCSGAPGASSTVGLGILSTSAASVSPVAATPNLGTATNGIAILQTNAQNGTNVYYDAIAASSGTNHLGALRVSGATCNAGNVNTDQCINSIGTTQATITAGTEDFGFTIGGVSCVTEQTFSGAYACAYSGSSEHLVPQTNYIGASAAYGTSNGFAYNETTGTSNLIAAAASGNIVTDEALIMNFAASPNVATPAGSYAVNVDYTAVSSY